MLKAVRTIFVCLSAIRLIPHAAALMILGRDGVLREDLARWSEVYRLRRPTTTISFLILFIEVMTAKREFRNVFYMRIGGVSRLISWLCPPLSSLHISGGDIGPGLFIQHGIGTIISAEHIGRNFWVNQGVTIGFSNETDRPWIGDNVKVHAGAKVIGRLTLSDHAIVGLNTVVTTDVAKGNTVFGIPGRVIWKSPYAESDYSGTEHARRPVSRAA